MKTLRLSPPVFTALLAPLLVILLGVGVARHPSFAAQHPFNLVWVVVASAVAAAMVLLNRAGVKLTAAGAYFGYGVLACIAGFVLQQAINTALLGSVGSHHPGIGAYTALGLGAALCQAAGKVLGIVLARRARQPTSLCGHLTIGLGVGVGFAVTEIVLIGQGMLVQESALHPPALISFLERGSAGLFHVYAGALIAIGLATRQAWPLLAVLAIHTAEDSLAGAAGAHLLPWPLLATEAVFLALGILTWLLYRRAWAAAWRGEAGEPNEAGSAGAVPG